MPELLAQQSQGRGRIDLRDEQSIVSGPGGFLGVAWPPGKIGIDGEAGGEMAAKGGVRGGGQGQVWRQVKGEGGGEGG